MVSLVIPSYNNLRHLKNCYQSIKKHAPQIEMILIDDGSNDGTTEWLEALDDSSVKKIYSKERLGHTIQYDVGIAQAKYDIVGIFHADMIMGPNYIKNMLKHLKKKTVVCGTRVEPPIHPEGREKIIMNFGMDFDDLRIADFEAFCIRTQDANKDIVTSGMFAPWIIYKEDFDRIGGHDPIFAPFPYEDSDIFQRWILQGYELIQSRDALVYHLTCRGHRFTEQIGKDDEYYKVASYKAARNYIRKWGSWIKNDEYQHPIVPRKYDIAFVIKGEITEEYLGSIEPWCSNLYLDEDQMYIAQSYIQKEQSNTTYDLSQKIKSSSKNLTWKMELCSNDVIVEFKSKDITLDNHSFYLIQSMSEVLSSDQIEPWSEYEFGSLKIIVRKSIDRVRDLIFIRK